MEINYEVLNRFLDGDGRVKQMPSKYEKKLNVIYYLGSKFEIGSKLNESEVNEIIREWILFDDYVTMRRFLVDFKFLKRDKNGNEYEVNEYEIN